jgi:hypothetical protein
MNSIPNGDQNDKKLLTETFNSIAEYLEKSSNAYKRTGVDWIIDKLQQFKEDENKFMNELTKWKHGFNKRYSIREKERISYKGLQERSNEKNYTRTRRNPVGESSSSENLEENKIKLCSDHKDNTAASVAATVETVAADKVSTPKNVNLKGNNNIFTLPNSLNKSEKRKLDALDENVDEHFAEDASSDKKQEITSAEKNRSSKSVDIVDKLMKSVYSHEYCADKHVLEKEISLADFTDIDLNFVEGEHLKRIFVLDYNIEKFERQKSHLSRRTALFMMEIAKISEDYGASENNSLTKQMIPVYRTYASQNGFSDPKEYSRKKVKTLYQFIRRGTLVLRMVEILNGKISLDRYIPYNFHWARFYNLTIKDLDRFYEMLRAHVNKRMKESKLALISKDSELSNESEKNVIFSESKFFDESSSKGSFTPEVFSFDSSDEIYDGSC